MQIDFLKDISSRIAGPNAVKVVEILHKKKNVNEFLIAKKLNLTINQTRNILYRLADEGLVSFVRKKDSKKGGWYIYFWTLNTSRAIELLRQQVSDKVDELQREIDKKKDSRFYYDKEADIEYTEEQALEYDFISPETGEVLELKDTSDEVKKLEAEIDGQKNILEDVNKEVEEIQKKEQKARERKRRAEEKKKAEERAKKKAERDKARKKAKKKTVKGAVKKKSAKKVKKKSASKKKSTRKRV